MGPTFDLQNILRSISRGFLVLHLVLLDRDADMLHFMWFDDKLGERCFDSQYKRELVMVYLSNVEQICKRFVEEKRGSLGKLIEDKTKWSRFWSEINPNSRRLMSKEKLDSILKLAVEKDNFILVDDVLALLQRAALEPLPPKDDKGSQSRTKDGGSGDDFGKESIERDERRLTEVGCRTIELFVLSHIFSSKIEVEYQEVVALKRQKELIHEEEAEWMTGFEQKAKWGASEKDKKSKKKQIVVHLRRLDVGSPVNDDQHFAAVESSIISNILSMDFDGCDDDTIFPQTIAGLYEGKNHHANQELDKFSMFQDFRENQDCIYKTQDQGITDAGMTPIGSALSSLYISSILNDVLAVLPDYQKFIQLLEKFEEGFINNGLPGKHDYEKGKVSRDIAEYSIFKDEKEFICSNGVAANELLVQMLMNFDGTREKNNKSQKRIGGYR
ncbi:hypothetical protein Tco_0892141 [Tanacetum coccineum]|uniref:Uncharacterized protein n=1 Tax=Tanacetum coccineum TaxID=301880 RepID=A0ABQ5C6M7_9ASTR